MNQDVMLAIVSIGLVGMLCQWVAWRLKLPAILFLLLSGILIGPLLGWLDPDAVFGDLLFPIVSLGVAVILFEGGLTLKLEEIRDLARVVRNLVTVGTVISATTTALATHYLVGFSWEVAFLFGALMVVTGPTVIVPMLRTVRPAAPVANVLRWEGIVIDPLGALLTVVVFNFIVSSHEASDLGRVMLTFAETLATGATVGGVVGYILGLVLRRHWLPEYLHNVVTFNLVLGVFIAANALAHEGGLLAVTLMGMVLGNMRDVRVEEILDFKETLSLLVISALFIVLAARIEPEAFARLGWGALGVLLVIQFVGRPLKVLVSAFGSSLTWQERTLIAWMGPRGVVAAAVAAVFALRLQELGYAEASLIVPLAFSVIIGTVLLQGATSRFIASLLGVAEPEPNGLLVIGANPVARAMAKALAEKGFEIRVTDSNWDNIRAARMQGLKTYHGNPISDHADRHLDLVGIGRLLGLSYMDDLNALAALRYRTEFGAGEVYALEPSAEKTKGEKHTLAPERRGRLLFGEGATYPKLASLISKGVKVRSTRLTESFGFHELYKQSRGRLIPLFAITPKGRLRIFTTQEKLEPKEGWTVLSLSGEVSGEQREASPL